jgi:hypothetical protein
MNKEQKLLQAAKPKLPTAKDINSGGKVTFPFTVDFSEDYIDVIYTQIWHVNYWESVQIKDKNIPTLAEHIRKIIGINELNILKAGELTEEYFEIVEKIAVGHEIRTKSTNIVEDNLTSFASKFCGHHNQKAPFFDRYVFELMNYWIGDKFKLEWRNYRNYVEAFKLLQKQQKLEKFSLRDIESYMWKVAKEILV